MKSKTLERMAAMEYGFSRPVRAKLLETLGYIVKQAENQDNSEVFFITEDIGHGTMNTGVVIQNIDALWGMTCELGSDFNPKYMLNGMKEATQDGYEGYCMSVLTTHDLNSAIIPNISELMIRLRLVDY